MPKWQASQSCGWYSEDRGLPGGPTTTHTLGQEARLSPLLCSLGPSLPLPGPQFLIYEMGIILLLLL